MQGKIFVHITFFLGSFLHTACFSQSGYDEKVTTAGNVSLTLSNLGIIGNGFGSAFDIKGFPSCEFPKNSGIEHVFEGALWMGGLINGGVTAVSTGSFDNSSGYSSGTANYEFTPISSSQITEKSSLTENPNYRKEAVSHQDFSTSYTDKHTQVPGTGIFISNHTNPLGIDVYHKTYNWNFSFANFFVPLDYTLINSGSNTIDSFYVGFWMNGVVRNINITPPGGTPFFNKGGTGYIDSLFLSYQFDANGDVPYTNSYVGVLYLGADDKRGAYPAALNAPIKVHYNAWQFKDASNPVYFSPVDDQRKFAKMAFGLNDNPNWKSVLQTELKQPNNRTHLVSVGPFKKVSPGDTLHIAFALVLAKKFEDGKPTSEDNLVQKRNLFSNANWALTAYRGNDQNGDGKITPDEDIDGSGKLKRWLLPSPPDAPKVKILALDQKIELYWTSNAENSINPISNKKDFAGYRIYRTQTGFDLNANVGIDSALKLLAQFDVKGDGLFFETGFDAVRLSMPKQFEGDTNHYTYKYVIDKVPNGWQTAVAITAFDMGDKTRNVGSLESDKISAAQYLFPGKQAVDPSKTEQVQPFVYPNPYYTSAAWEGAVKVEEDRKLIFANLPATCKVQIYTSAGDLVDAFSHSASDAGTDIRWFKTYSNTSKSGDSKTVFSGGEHAWDLLSNDRQIPAPGLYLFTVEDNASGKVNQGQFLIVR